MWMETEYGNSRLMDDFMEGKLMGRFFKTWKTVLLTSETELFFRAKNLLYEQGIPYKSKTSCGQQRAVMNRWAGTGIALGRTDFEKNFYHILVSEENERRARAVLANIKRPWLALLSRQFPKFP